MNKTFDIKNTKLNRESINKSISLYFEKIYPSIELKLNYNKFKEEFTEVFNNNLTRIAFPVCVLNEDGSIADSISPEFVNLKSNAGNGGETLTKYLLYKMLNITDVIYEPNGEGTHPDFLIKLNDKNILVEIKTIYCNEFNKDGTLKIKVNNATNSEGAVRKYLNEYKKYFDNKFNLDEFIQNNDINTETRQFFETFVVFYYYEIDNKLNCINYFDFEIIPLPVVISFMLTDDGYLMYDNNNNVKLTLKSAGETSLNNNVNLTLYLKSIFDEENNILIDPLMLYLLGHTYKNNDHIITTNELKQKLINQYIKELSIDMNNILKSESIDSCKKIMDNIKIKYKFCSKNKHLIDDKLFEKHKIKYQVTKDLFKKTVCILNFIKINNKLIHIVDKDLYIEFRKTYNKLKKYGISETEYDDLFYEQKIKYNKIRG